jgi:hypothetical protein
MNIVWGILGMIISYLLIRYRGKIYEFTGSWSFADKIGGTGNAIVLVAIVLFFLSLTVMLGKAKFFFGGAVGRFF